MEDILGHKIEHFCLPGGQYTEEILKIVYKYYRTVRSADTMNFRYKSGVFKPSIHFFPRGNKSLLGNALRNKSYSQAGLIIKYYQTDYFELLRKLIENEQKNIDSKIMIWGHSWEIEALGLWDELDRLMFYVKTQYSDAICKYNDMFS